jgi:hypothetical protein
MNVAPEQTVHGSWNSYSTVTMSGFSACSIVVVYNKHGFLASNISPGDNLEQGAMTKLCTTYTCIKSTVFGNEPVNLLILCEQLNIQQGGLMRSIGMSYIRPSAIVARYFDAPSFIGNSATTAGCHFSIWPGVGGFNASLKGVNGKSVDPLTHPEAVLRCP